MTIVERREKIKELFEELGLVKQTIEEDKEPKAKALTDADVKEVVDRLDEMTFQALSLDGEFKTGTGTLKTVQRKERKGRNPKTKEEIVIPAKKTIVFKPAKETHTRLNGTK